MENMEYDIKVNLRAERDRLLEIRRVLPENEENQEAIRLLEVRLATIKENLES